jgi:glycosyltransferase involved in cell wall biosynthesis
MRVLFLTYPRIGLNRGGLQIQIEETAQGLTDLGVEVIRYDPWQNQIPNVDVCHVFSIDGSMVYHASRAVSLGVPVIISPVLNAFDNRPIVTMLKRQLSALPGCYSDLRRAGTMLHAASTVVALNPDEREMLIKVFKVDSSKCCVIPNGINMAFSQGDPTLFDRAHGISNFVLNVASIEPRKNQLTLVRALKNLPYPLVLIGKATPENDAYLAQCKTEAGANVRFLGALNHEDPMLAAAYAAAKLFVMPSLSEVMPLTLYEAAVAGCRILTSDQVPVSASLAPLIKQCPPNDVATLMRLIDEEMRAAQTDSIHQAVMAMPTWGEVCQQLADLYQNLVNCREPVNQSVGCRC